MPRYFTTKLSREITSPDYFEEIATVEVELTDGVITGHAILSMTALDKEEFTKWIEENLSKASSSGSLYSLH